MLNLPPSSSSSTLPRGVATVMSQQRSPATMRVKSNPFFTDFRCTWLGSVAKPTQSFSWKQSTQRHKYYQICCRDPAGSTDAVQTKGGKRCFRLTKVKFYTTKASLNLFILLLCRWMTSSSPNNVFYQLFWIHFNFFIDENCLHA